MNNFRQYILILSSIFLLFILMNYGVWSLFTKKILVREGEAFVGDLARVGYLPELTQPRVSHETLPRKHIPFYQYSGQHVELITFGDSFSNGMGFGPNRFYQDFIASRFGVEVLNLPPLTDYRQSLADLVVLANSGYLEKLGADYLLLQMAERNCLTRLGEEVDFSHTMPLAEVEKLYLGKARWGQYTDKLPEVNFINTGNLKFLLNKAGYLFRDKAIFGGLYKLGLDRKLFSHPQGDTLIVIDKDIRKLRNETPATLGQINDNLNRLADLLETKGVSLIFMPAPNKYTIYRPYLVDQSYPSGRFFESFRTLEKRYHYIDTEEILSRLVANGELDVYYIDDTHWSDKASRAIVADMKLPER